MTTTQRVNKGKNKAETEASSAGTSSAATSSAETKAVPAETTPVEKTEETTAPEYSIGDAINQIIQEDEKERPTGAELYENIQKVNAATRTVAFAGMYAHIAYLSLTPVYGSTQAMLYHGHGMMVAALSGWVGRSYLEKYLPRNIDLYLPVWAFFIPTIQHFFLQQSSIFPVPYGPVITELFTYYPLVFLSTYVAAQMTKDIDASALGSRFAEHGPPLIAYLIFGASGKFAEYVLARSVGVALIATRVGLQLLFAVIYSIFFPSKLLLLAIPSLIFTAGFNPHFNMPINTALVNSTLIENNWVLRERQESTSGYMSVLENLDTPYKVLRADHSLLGGVWTKYPVGYAAPQLAEPIYGVFTMLEAVRLVEPAKNQVRVADTDAEALVIGLGVGTTPGAFITHGINTTIVEFDYVVYDFAIRHFDLPSPHRASIGDALQFVSRARSDVSQLGRYDYIVHDVFTGGAEPVDLFTGDFIMGLSYLLKSDGVIAINYAGDLSLPSPGLVVRTIKSVFPTCRIFREFEQNQDPATKSGDGGDFTNMVIFCTKEADTPLTFRKAKKADLLGSKTREKFIPPTLEIDAKIFEKKEGEQELLEVGSTKEIQKWQTKSAIGHWLIMRDLIPAAVWQAW